MTIVGKRQPPLEPILIGDSRQITTAWSAFFQAVADQVTSVAGTGSVGAGLSAEILSRVSGDAAEAAAREAVDAAEASARAAGDATEASARVAAIAVETARAEAAEAALAPRAAPVFTGSIGLTVGGPTWTTGSTAPSSTQPVGSLYSRLGGAVGSTLYVSRGGGTWLSVAGV